jgi:RNA polymerase sigma-70 factor (ECF subfamily)
LPERLAGRIDSEDVVQSAYRSFFAGAQAGRYDLERGGDLWNLLVTITLHKLFDQVERYSTQKRAVHREQPFSSEKALQGLQACLAADEPSPLEAVALIDRIEQLMRRLEPWEPSILELRLQGHDLNEIAARTQWSQRTVRRVLDKVKGHLQRWQEEDLGP